MCGLHVGPRSWSNETSLWDVFWECSAFWNSLAKHQSCNLCRVHVFAADTKLKQNAVCLFIVCLFVLSYSFSFFDNAAPQWPHSTANRGENGSAGWLVATAVLRHQWVHGARRLQGGKLLPSLQILEGIENNGPNNTWGSERLTSCNMILDSHLKFFGLNLTTELCQSYFRETIQERSKWQRHQVLLACGIGSKMHCHHKGNEPAGRVTPYWHGLVLFVLYNFW